MKILYVTTVGITMNFFKSLIKDLIEKGNVVDIATNDSEYKVDSYFYDLGCKIYHLDCTRSPFNINNINTIKQLKRVSKDYDIVHCHTPVASICTRLACKKIRNKGLKVIYTAHGFHFYKGAPLLNWLIYYPIEKICSYWTDVLITINKDDYELAKSRMRAKRIEYVPGVGINMNKYRFNILSEQEKEQKKKELNISKNDKVFLSVGELSNRKNHAVVIEALSDIGIKNYKYIIVGSGDKKAYLLKIIKEKHLENNIILLGQRNDVSELLDISDLFIFPSLQEGLPVALMEAISSKTAVICSNIRGNKELVDNKCLFDPKDIISIDAKIEYFVNNDITDTINNNYECLRKFDFKKVNNEMSIIYSGEVQIF